MSPSPPADASTMNATLTEEQVRAWEKAGRLGCPCCGPDQHVSYDSYDSEDWTVWQNATCQNCGLDFQVIYDFSRIEGSHGDGPTFAVSDNARRIEAEKLLRRLIGTVRASGSSDELLEFLGIAGHEALEQAEKFFADDTPSKSDSEVAMGRRWSFDMVVKEGEENTFFFTDHKTDDTEFYAGCDEKMAHLVYEALNAMGGL